MINALYLLGMLIPGKSHSCVESGNPGSRSRLDFTRVRTFYQRDRSWIVGSLAGARGGGAIAGRPPMLGPHCRLRTIVIAGGGAPKTAGGGYGGARPGKCNGYRPADDGPGNHRLPPIPSDTAGDPTPITQVKVRTRAKSITGFSLSKPVIGFPVPV